VLGVRYRHPRPLKVYRGAVADRLFPRIVPEGFGFTEILLLAEKLGAPAVDPPPGWKAGDDAPVNVPHGRSDSGGWALQVRLLAAFASELGA
jgi:hypothetical protein